MVQLPPERRKLSVLPYIINQYTLDSDDEDENYEGGLENYFIDEDGSGCYNYNESYGYDGNNGYDVVVGTDIGGEDVGSIHRGNCL